jgi:predicted dehydrogenase
VAWDLAPHDISIILHIMEEQAVTINCQGSARVTPGIEDVTTIWLGFTRQRSAIIHSSWLDPRKVREMTIVGSKRMIVYDDVSQLEKIRIFDARVERPPHYDTFAEFHYAYHYGDVHVPYIKQEEPLKTECQHFLDCIRSGTDPMSSGEQGLRLVRILESASVSLKNGGAPVSLMEAENRQSNGNGNGHAVAPAADTPAIRIAVRGVARKKPARPTANARKQRGKILGKILRASGKNKNGLISRAS